MNDNRDDRDMVEEIDWGVLERQKDKIEQLRKKIKTASEKHESARNQLVRLQGCHGLLTDRLRLKENQEEKNDKENDLTKSRLRAVEKYRQEQQHIEATEDDVVVVPAPSQDDDGIFVQIDKVNIDRDLNCSACHKQITEDQLTDMFENILVAYEKNDLLEKMGNDNEYPEQKEEDEDEEEEDEERAWHEHIIPLRENLKREQSRQENVWQKLHALHRDYAFLNRREMVSLDRHDFEHVNDNIRSFMVEYDFGPDDIEYPYPTNLEDSRSFISTLVPEDVTIYLSCPSCQEKFDAYAIVTLLEGVLCAD